MARDYERARPAARPYATATRASLAHGASSHNRGRGPYGAIYRSLWSQEDFRRLSFDAKGLFCYLRTCPHASLLGIFTFHPDWAAVDLALPSDRVITALNELEAGFFIHRSPDAPGWLWVVSSFGSTPGISLRNPKHVGAVQRGLDSIPPPIANLFRKFYLDGVDTQSDSLPYSQSDPTREGPTR